MTEQNTKFPKAIYRHDVPFNYSVEPTNSFDEIELNFIKTDRNPIFAWYGYSVENREYIQCICINKKGNLSGYMGPMRRKLSDEIYRQMEKLGELTQEERDKYYIEKKNFLMTKNPTQRKGEHPYSPYNQGYGFEF